MNILKMRRIKVAVFLTIMVLVVILQDTALASNDSQRYCDVTRLSLQVIQFYVSITAKPSYKDVPKHEFPSYELGDILFFSNITIKNIADSCTIPISFIYFQFVDPQNTMIDVSCAMDEEIKPSGTDSIEVDRCHILNLDKIGTWKINNLVIRNDNIISNSIPFYLENRFKDMVSVNGYIFEVYPKLTLENQDLIKALANSSIESANAAKEATGLSKRSFCVAILAVIISLVFGFLTFYYSRKQLKSGDEQKKELEKQTQSQDEIKDILKNSRTPKD